MIKVLSLHFTKECNRSCANCYMKNKTGKQKDFDFFMSFPKIAKELKIKQIALGGGEPTLFPEFVEDFSKECKKNKVICNMTTNGSGISNETISKYKNLTMISFSVDKHKILSVDDLNSIFKKMDLAKENGTKVGCNLQLDDHIIENLYNFIAGLKVHADYIYLLQTKPSTIKVNKELKPRILGACSLFDNVFVDESLKMVLGLSKKCGRGKGIVSIDFAGRLYKCSFDEPFAQLEKAEDLVKVVKNNYPFESTTKCPFV